MSFVDRVEVTLKAGRGGDGALSFHHEKFKAKGGPDGGDGGDGGDIVLTASRNQNSLADFRYKKLIKAEDGKSGQDRKKHGRSGQNLEVDMPVGTLVTDLEGNVLADLIEDGQTAVVVNGGKGGFGNAHFTSSRRQAPRVAEKGEPGESREVVMELKMLADVGIVGLPNAGKSTLLSVISNAKPEVANYPFTTLHPYLGVVDIDGKHSLLFADIPGLIDGASQGKGLGDEFLRHVERTSVLIHLIDAYNEDVIAAHRTIMRELADYKIDLSGRPQIIALAKTEGLDSEQIDDEIKKLRKVVGPKTAVLAISSASQSGIKELLREVLKIVNSTKKANKPTKKAVLPVIGLKAEDDWQIQKTDEEFMVTGQKIERFASRTHFGDYHAEQRLRDIMGKTGITDSLRRQGIVSGQVIIFGQPEIGRISY